MDIFFFLVVLALLAWYFGPRVLNWYRLARAGEDPVEVATVGPTYRHPDKDVRDLLKMIEECAMPARVGEVAMVRRVAKQLNRMEAGCAEREVRCNGVQVDLVFRGRVLVEAKVPGNGGTKAMVRDLEGHLHDYVRCNPNRPVVALVFGEKDVDPEFDAALRVVLEADQLSRRLCGPVVAVWKAKRATRVVGVA